ncbi:MAG: hypothetical protein E7440_06800, partial [Ruminococcaceae bacterium]|nr:hypothetical protein [Oscillospiraceae bacterium]
MKTRILSWLLILSMAFSCLPVTAFAAEGDNTSFEPYFEDFNTLGSYDIEAEGAGFVKKDKYATPLAGSYAFEVVQEGDTQALKVSVAKTDTASGRAWLRTAETFSGSYTLEARFKGNDKGNLSELRLPGVQILKHNKTAATYTTGDYELRINGSQVWIELNTVTALNAATGETANKTASLYLLDEENVLQDSEKLSGANTWFTVKVHVDAQAKTVVTELYNDESTLLGSRVLYGATVSDAPITLDHYGNSTTARETYWDYIKVSEYAYEGDVPGYTYTVTEDTCVNGSVKVDATGNVAYGTKITVTATSTKPGYVVKNVYVNDTAINGNTFYLTENATVTADFWPEGSIWHEDFDRYDENQDVYVAPLNAASNDSLEWHNFA